MEYHPSKKHIKASIILQEELRNIPTNITLPFFIEYGTMYPFILYIFKRVMVEDGSGHIKDELHFIEEGEMEYLFEYFFHYPTSFVNHDVGGSSIFYEIQNKTSIIPIDLSGTLYDDTTMLWFASPYEIYHTKNVFDIPFSSQVIEFFLDNPSLEKLYWDHKVQPSPIIAYSQNNLRKTKFQSTFGAEHSPTPPHYTVYKNIVDPLSPTVRYALFYPYEEKDDVITFVQHIQHIPICYIHSLPLSKERISYDVCCDTSLPTIDEYYVDV
jgi:hypothetical protein